MVNVCVYDAIAIPAVILLNHQMRVANNNQLSCLRKKQ